jgi:hypothetical protein
MKATSEDIEIDLKTNTYCRPIDLHVHIEGEHDRAICQNT